MARDSPTSSLTGTSRNFEPAKSLPARPPGRPAPAGDGGNDGERVGCGDSGCVFGGEIAYVFVVEVNVHEGAQPALGREEVVAQIWMGAGERAERLGDGGRIDLNRGLAAGIGAQRRGDEDGHEQDTSALLHDEPWRRFDLRCAFRMRDVGPRRRLAAEICGEDSV